VSGVQGILAVEQLDYSVCGLEACYGIMHPKSEARCWYYVSLSSYQHCLLFALLEVDDYANA